jgi:hypothetical protein
MLIFAEYQKYLLALARPVMFGRPDTASEPS